LSSGSDLSNRRIRSPRSLTELNGSQSFTGGTLLNSYGGLILPLVGWALPICILAAFMKRVPLELAEAARAGGAGDLRIFLRGLFSGSVQG
jgi:hypothetical protein